MTAKKERGAQDVADRKIFELQRGTTAYAMLQRIGEHGTVKPEALHNIMPARRQNTVTVLNYMARLETLKYATVNRHDEISITQAGRDFLDNKPQAPTPKHVGIPAAPRLVSVWTEPMKDYDKNMRAGRRPA